MTRLIDAQDTFNVLSDYYHHSTHVQHLALQEALNKVPTAVPVRHGKWIVKGQEIFCSVCGEESSYTWHGSSKFSNYCPYCGADMRGNETS